MSPTEGVEGPVSDSNSASLTSERTSAAIKFSVVIFTSRWTVAPGLETFGKEGFLDETGALLDAEATLLEPAMRLIGVV